MPPVAAHLTERAESITICGPAITVNVEQLLGDAATPDLTALFCRLLRHARDRKQIDMWRAVAAHEEYSVKP